MLRQTSEFYVAVDYVATICLHEEGDHGLPNGNYLVAVQVTIQREHKKDKVGKMVNVPSELISGLDGVLYILINPMWQNFDEMHELAIAATSGPAGNRFASWWYGHPSDYSPVNALLTYIDN